MILGLSGVSLRVPNFSPLLSHVWYDNGTVLNI